MLDPSPEVGTTGASGATAMVNGGLSASAGEANGNGAPAAIPVAALVTSPDSADVSAVEVAMDRDVRPWIDLIDSLRSFGIEMVRSNRGRGRRHGCGEWVGGAWPGVSLLSRQIYTSLALTWQPLRYSSLPSSVVLSPLGFSPLCTRPTLPVVASATGLAHSPTVCDGGPEQWQVVGPRVPKRRPVPSRHRAGDTLRYPVR